jgi:di/tricarboxylate transporter
VTTRVCVRVHALVTRALTDLEPSNNEAIELELTGEGRAKHRHMAEAVVSASSPFLGLTVREAKFRETYSAAIIAIYRAGGRVTTRVGDIVLRAGDNLLLECSQAFVATHRTSTDFQLVSMLEDSSRVPRQPVYVMVITVVLVITMVVIAAIASLNTGYFIMALAVCFCMWWLGTLTVNEARVAINLPVMVMIAGSIGFSTAISNAGLDRAIALNLINLFQPLGELGILFSIYISVAVLNAVISNKVCARAHCAVIMYDVCLVRNRRRYH